MSCKNTTLIIILAATCSSAIAGAKSKYWFSINPLENTCKEMKEELEGKPFTPFAARQFGAQVSEVDGMKGLYKVEMGDNTLFMVETAAECKKILSKVKAAKQ